MLRAVWQASSVIARRASPAVQGTSLTTTGVRTFSSSWSHIPKAPADAIFGLTAAYNLDKSPHKINLGVGAYRDNDGKPYVLPSIREAEDRIHAARLDHEYATIAGIPEFVRLSNVLTFGQQHDVIQSGRYGAVQTVSGTGALRTAGDFCSKFLGESTPIFLPTPTWGNHAAIFEASGLNVQSYRYYDYDNISLDFSGMCEDLKAMPDGSIVLLQACAMNPTGVDPTEEQWRELSALLKDKNVSIMFDNAYQGYASGDTNRDAFSVRLFADEGHDIMVCQSYSKNMGLYGQRAGCLTVVTQDAEAGDAVTSQLKKVVRPTYSNPPIHGARIVKTVLADPQLEAQWREDCAALAARINDMRSSLRSALESTNTQRDWSHITSQIGMFSFTGLDKSQVEAIIRDHHVYMTSDGRISVAGVNSHNVEYLANAIHEVTK